MRLLIIRHGQAGDSETFARTGMDDDLRPLTPDGVTEMSSIAKGLARLVPRIDVLASSPLVRAVQTAESIAEQHGGIDIRITELLRPDGAHSRLLRALDDLTDDPDRIIAIVGHRPHLHEFVGWLLTGESRPIISVRKGAALLIRPNKGATLGPGRGRLVWALAPDQLVMLGS